MVLAFSLVGIVSAGEKEELSNKPGSATLAPELRTKPFSENTGMEFQAAAKMLGAETQLRDLNEAVRSRAVEGIGSLPGPQRIAMDAPGALVQAAKPAPVTDLAPMRAGMDAPTETVL